MSDPQSGINVAAKVSSVFGLKGEKWMRHSNPTSVWTLRRPSHPHRLDLAREIDRPARLHPAGGLKGGGCSQPALLQGAALDAELGLEGVLGERIWAERARTELPDQLDSVVPAVASAYQAIGFVPLVYGLAALEATPTLTGMLILQGGKLWYIDRKVLLFEEMKRIDPEYSRCEY